MEQRHWDEKMKAVRSNLNARWEKSPLKRHTFARARFGDTVPRVFWAFFLFIGLCGPAGRAQNQISPASDPEGQARSLLHQAIEALGGPAYLAVQDITMSGRAYRIYRGATSAAAVFVSYLKYPDKERQEIGKKKGDILIYNGDQGWDVDFRGVHPLTPDDMKDYHQSQEFSIDHILRIDIKAGKYRIYYDGTDFVEGIKYDIITLEDRNRERLALLLNASTHLPELLRYRIKDPSTDGIDHYESWWGNFQHVQGLTVPLHRIRLRNGYRIAETFISEMKFNSGLSDALFTPLRKN